MNEEFIVSPDLIQTNQMPTYVNFVVQKIKSLVMETGISILISNTLRDSIDNKPVNGWDYGNEIRPLPDNK